MKPLYVAAAVGSLLVPLPVWAQGTGSTATHTVPGNESVGTNGLKWAPYSATNPFPPSAPASGTPTETTVVCGVTSVPLLAAGAATAFIFYQNNSTASVGFNVSGATASLAAPSILIAAGGSQTWPSAQSAFLPTSQINCSSSISASVTLIYK